MESNGTVFNQLNVELFDRVDLMIENQDHKGMSDMIYQQFEDSRLINQDDFFSGIIPVSIIASIVCDQEDDLLLDEEGFAMDNCKAIYFSEVIEDLIIDGRIDDAMEYTEFELLRRERYELLNEMKKYEKNR
jgi:hypothetical protein